MFSFSHAIYFPIAPRQLLLAGLAAVTIVTTGHAAEAAFSADGKFVYFFRRWESAKPDEPVDLTELDLQKRSSRKIDLSSLKPPGGFIAIDRWADGLLLLTGRMLYTYDPKTQASSVVCEAPEDEGFEDVAADPKTGDILITGFVKPGHEDRLGWYYLAGEKQLLLVTARRIDQMVSPTFSPEGLLLFGVHGDLWAGRISLVDPAFSNVIIVIYDHHFKL